MIPKFKWLTPFFTKVAVFSLIIFSLPCKGNEVPFTGRSMIIGKYLEIAEDTNGSRSFNDLKFLKFSKSTDETPNFGLSKSTWWIKFTIRNYSSNNSVFLELGYPMIHSGELFTADSSGVIVQKISEKDTFYQRKINHQNIVFNLHIRKNESKTYFLKIREDTQIVLPLFVRNQNSFFQASLISEILTGIYIGVLFVMMLYNLFLYFSIRENSYLYYVIYILSIGLAQLTLTGYAFKLLWPYSPYFNSIATSLFSTLSGIFAVLFFRNFLNTKEKTPLLNNGLSIIIVSYVLALIFQLSGNTSLSYTLTNLSGVASIILAILVSAILSLQNYRPAKFFLIAWSIFFLGLALFVLRNLNILPYNNFTNYTMQAGTAIEVILLSFALADKINVLKREKEISQEQALLISLENEKIITEQNVMLEKNVEERTRELRQTNTELNTTLTQLKDTQTQLIESEKMASLGQLTAGIAHEINNPINFVSSNIRPLRRDIDDLIQIVDAYSELYVSEKENVKLSNKLKDIEDLKSNLDLEYIKTELGILLKGMEDGAHRTVEIVKGLKMFARVDDSDLNMVNINEGIESTLVILNYQMGSSIRLIKELGNIPNIEGYGGKLNQVFMNILTNSIYVIQKNPNDSPTIWVKTWLNDPQHICISIRDNGTGMTPEVRSKIFDPFFTTKQVGDGTGLGLSIVFKIIEVHSGHIVVNTELGKGTEFIITLPIIKKNHISAFNE